MSIGIKTTLPSVPQPLPKWPLCFWQKYPFNVNVNKIKSPGDSVTRLAKFRQFGKILKVLGRFCGFLLFGNISNLLWQILYAAGQIFIDVNGHTSHIPSFDWTIIEECSADSVTSWFEEKVEKLFFKNRPKLDTADFTRNEMFFSWHDFWPIWAHF